MQSISGLPLPGNMAEYPVAQAFKDARVIRIYGGTTEFMKLLIARPL